MLVLFDAVKVKQFLSVVERYLGSLGAYGHLMG